VTEGIKTVKDRNFGIIVITFMVIFGVLEVLFTPWTFRLGVFIGLFLATTIHILHRALVKKAE
jgi:hypothetical protein